MNRVCRWLTNLLCRTLEKNEREAVRGDLVELGQSGSRAMRDVLGLVVRRQFAVWSDWRLWLVLVTAIVPITMLLSLVSSEKLGIGSVYGWLYFSNWDSRLLHERAFWYVLADSFWFLCGRCLTVGCWAWSAGFLLGRSVLFKRKPCLVGTLFCVGLLLGALEGEPAYFRLLFSMIHRTLPSARFLVTKDPVSAHLVYRTVLPLVAAAVFVALPAVLGMLQGRSVRPRMGTFMFLATASLIGIALQVPGLIFLILLKMGMRPETWQGWPSLVHSIVELLLIVSYWPAAYLLIKVAFRLSGKLKLIAAH